MLVSRFANRVLLVVLLSLRLQSVLAYHSSANTQESAAAPSSLCQDSDDATGNVPRVSTRLLGFNIGPFNGRVVRFALCRARHNTPQAHWYTIQHPFTVHFAVTDQQIERSENPPAGTPPAASPLDTEAVTDPARLRKESHEAHIAGRLTDAEREHAEAKAQAAREEAARKSRHYVRKRMRHIKTLQKYEKNALIVWLPPFYPPIRKSPEMVVQELWNKMTFETRRLRLSRTSKLLQSRVWVMAGPMPHSGSPVRDYFRWLLSWRVILVINITKLPLPAILRR